MTDYSLYGERCGRVIFDVAELCELFDSHGVDLPKDTVLRWFFDYIQPVVSPTTSPTEYETAYEPSGNVILESDDAKRKCDLHVCSRVPGSQERTRWDQVRVIGELKANPEQDALDATFIQLANYLRKIFGTQPRRSCVLAFTLCGAVMRVFRFDRSAAMASTAIDIH
ncbi:hypothetical protein FN846DRAFT_902436 [Sphaerosporella brunnea]|uniref:Fungal-type protein kinase domain-containing protein n=1 Tax=Sphaerosporella brunnea TaxID=1250544 RepID=A0A5J5F9Y1_9PEZI|nr:hypothetical protein FN846DRAFT_902436 [Sphaerosporella brunnea]